MNIEIANRLVKLRKEKGLSQEELAEKLGLSRQAISKWERGESSPDMDNIVMLAKLYDLSFDELLSTSEYYVEEKNDNKEKEVVVKVVEVVKKEYTNWWSIIALIISLISPIIGIGLIPAFAGLFIAEKHDGRGKVITIIAIVINVWNFLVWIFSHLSFFI